MVQKEEREEEKNERRGAETLMTNMVCNINSEKDRNQIDIDDTNTRTHKHTAARTRASTRSVERKSAQSSVVTNIHGFFCDS